MISADRSSTTSKDWVANIAP